MQVSRAAAIRLEYHRSHSRDNTLKSYEAALAVFLAEFTERLTSSLRSVKSGGRILELKVLEGMRIGKALEPRQHDLDRHESARAM